LRLVFYTPYILRQELRSALHHVGIHKNRRHAR
jgi:hypothetical protein